jgi:hypothetical protein
MAVLNEILGRAEHYLTTGWLTGPGRGGRVLPEVVYDHSQRVLQLAQALQKDKAMTNVKIDESILTASAMFHDAGWIDLVKHDELHVGQIFSRPADAAILDRGASVACDQLADLLSARQLETVSDVITGIKQMQPDRPETKLIADADNLEEFGLLGILLEVRSAQAAGKSARQILEGWNRRQEYHYWDARIKNAFHFETTRSLARERLANMSHVYELLCHEISPETVKGKPAVYNPPVTPAAASRKRNPVLL